MSANMAEFGGQDHKSGSSSVAVQTEPLPDESGGATEEQLYLRVLFDAGKPNLRDLGSGGCFSLKPSREPLAIGRDTRQSDGMLLIDDRSVSRQHVAIKVSADGSSAELRTLNTKNDTYVDGELIQGSCTVNRGSVLRIGGTLLLVCSRSDGRELSKVGKIAGMCGDSPTLQKVRWIVSQRADSQTPVLIWGESGVGKELVAEALHSQSGRRDKPFVRVNCATLSPALASSELFGHQKGAFTGAAVTTRGLFGEAADGTLFLDEIHWLPTEVQGQLLRALDTGRVRSLGGSSEQEYIVRVVAASNRDLRALSDKTSPPFLPDLRARLGDWYRVHIPPLRERREDILPIFAGLLTKEAELRHRPWLLEHKISWRLADVLVRRSWMNNVRDLRTVAQALVDLTREDAKFLSLDPVEEFLPTQDTAGEAQESSERDFPLKARRQKSQRLSEQDEAEVQSALARHHGNVRAAESETGVNERTIRRLLEKWRAEKKADEDIGGG